MFLFFNGIDDILGIVEENDASNKSSRGSAGLRDDEVEVNLVSGKSLNTMF